MDRGEERTLRKGGEVGGIQGIYVFESRDGWASSPSHHLGRELLTEGNADESP